MVTARDIARVLHGRKCGGGWVARCPSHGDREPSLSLRDADGRVLVYCHAGCAQSDVIRALRSLDLWPAAEAYTAAERREYGRRRRADERLMRAAHYFTVAARAMVEAALDTADHPDRIGLTDLLRDLRDAPLMLYADWRVHHPQLAAALVRAGRESDRRLQRRLAHYLAEGHRAA